MMLLCLECGWPFLGKHECLECGSRRCRVLDERQALGAALLQDERLRTEKAIPLETLLAFHGLCPCDERPWDAAKWQEEQRMRERRSHRGIMV